MELTKEQIEFLDKVCHGTWKLNSNGEVDVDGSVDMRGMNLTEIPVKFVSVDGYFDCSCNNLTSLVGSPTSVSDDFDCSDNNLTSLDGYPKSIVGGDFYCSNNQLTNYFKNTKEEEFPHWDKLRWDGVWWDILKEYPFLINIGKKYVRNCRECLDKYPQTKIYLE